METVTAPHRSREYYREHRRFCIQGARAAIADAREAAAEGWHKKALNRRLDARSWLNMAASWRNLEGCL